MNQRRRRLQVYRILIGILFCCAGCGLQKEKQDLDVSEVTTGAALYITEDYQSDEIQHQLDVLVENASKWRIADDGYQEENDKKYSCRYAVTDLNRNGRLEIMSLKEEDIEDKDFLQGLFEVNASGNGVEEIESDQIGDISLEDMQGKLDSGYYDPKTGECHYVMGNELAEEEMLSDDSEDYENDSEDYEKNIFALTLKSGQLVSETLAYQEQSMNQKGKIQSRFYQLDDRGKSEIDPSSYTVEALGDAVYADCGKYSVQFSFFYFDHNLEDMTEKQMHYALEKSYRESFMGYPLGKEEQKIAGQKILVPQYSTMQDAEKQKEINQMIVKQLKQSLQPFSESQDSENDWNVDIAIKYAGWDQLSLLLWAYKPYQGEGEAESAGEAAQWDTICDTINIDLEQGSLLSEQELLTESVREDVIENVEMDIDEKMEEYEEAGERQKFDTINKSLKEHLEKWQGILLYQTRDMIGLVIPTDHASLPYDTYEDWKDWGFETDNVSFVKIDWEAYQYRMLASEYQGLQEYMPLLTGGAEFVDSEEEWEEDDEETDDEGAAKSQNRTISGWVEEYYGDETAENISVSDVCICDVTQDGKPELILEFFGGSSYLILHKEGNTYYGTMKGKRELYGLQTNGVYGAGKYDYYYYQLHFEKDHFVSEYLGRYEVNIQAGDEKDTKYYIRDQKVEKDAYEKWRKSIMTEYASWYSPEALTTGE
ncbi:MAG: hypothetical protein K2K70_00585 [Lachnospiraceae bacterium]|nr:hypothetical protein [Lachnospiraceae bacterium]